MQFLDKFIYFARRYRLARILSFLLMIGCLASGIVTYLAITGTSSKEFGPDPKTVVGLILLDLILLLSLAVIVSRKMVYLWTGSKKNIGGNRLQKRIILLFGIVAVTPTIVVAIFSALFFNFGLQSWFNDRVATALHESVAVAEAYLAEHKEIIKGDSLAMASDINRQSYQLYSNPELFDQFINGQAALRSLTEAIIFQKGKILARTNLSFSLAFEKIPAEAMMAADKGEVALLTSDNDDKVRAVVKLDNVFDTYLLVGRFVDNKVLEHIDQTKGAANEYNRLRKEINNLQIKFSFIFIIVALLLLLAAIWFGMIFVTDLLIPVKNLLLATERVKAGDLTARLDEGEQNDELSTLSRAFNRMTEQLEKQRSELVAANRQIDERRRFSETVLSGLTSGVIALDAKKSISLLNSSARELLAADKGDYILDILPQFANIIAEAEEKFDKFVQAEISVYLSSKTLILLVRVTALEFSEQINGYILTFDDITELVNAQRSLVWADVARRIAHEIKNPLTPIHLAAERLKRKYLKEIQSDPDNFLRYIDTITRHVGDIGRIVEEFVNFARMPSPQFKQENIMDIIKSAIFSEECSNPELQYHLHLPSELVYIHCDKTQISQVLGNLLKNAAEANSIKNITVSLEKLEDCCKIAIIDDGDGFPQELLDRITEPYITTKPKGTGLGLAIVKKIIEDHGGKLELQNVDKGAMAVVILPR